MVKDLENEFIGIGDTNGFKFTKLASTDKGFLYSVDVGEGKLHYEIFNKKIVPICLDFEKKIFSETEFKYTYPKSEAFGSWAWCIQDYDKALEKFNNL
jgi:hypothetical protein